MAPREQSWPQFKYPTYRDSIGTTAYLWLEGKQKDDGADNLWRIHDHLYDLTSFIQEHPGGAMWLTLTKGTDITEAFESHHLTKTAEKKLPQFSVRKADEATSRNSPFTFHPNGFYKTLKQKVQKHFNYKSPVPSMMSTLYLDFYFHGGLLLSVLAARLQNFPVAMLAGVFYAFVVNCGHNFLHMKDTWRMYYYSVTGFSVREWRITHCLSHHLYPNTLKDLEISLFEPFLQFLPDKNKSMIIRFGSWILFPIVGLLAVHHQIIVRIITRKLEKDDCLVFLPPILMLLFGKFSFYTLILWLVIISFTGLTFTGIGLTAAHHNEDIFHEGDVPRDDCDWGLQQFDAVADRNEIMGNRFFGLIAFGEHTLHHLFPTIDFCSLQQLTPILHETLKEFGVENHNQKPIVRVILGTFKQLARNKPNTIENVRKMN